MSMTKAFRTVLLMVLATMLLVTGVAFGAGQQATGEGEEGPQEIALLLFSRGFEFMVALDQGATRKAEELGVEITVLDGQSDSQVQLRQIEDLIVRGIDAIVISPANSEEIVPGIRKANEAGIPVVSVDAIIGTGADVAGHVGFDNAEGGRVAAQYIIDQLGDGKVLETQGALGAYHAQKRHQGFNEVMADSDFEVVSKAAEWVASNAQAITADVLTAQSDVNAIFSHNDEMVRGIVAGLKQIDRFEPVGEEGHVLVVGIDGTPLALDRIRNGEQDASVQQDPFEMGARAIQAAVDALEGREVPPQQLLPPTLVTQENVDNPDLWGNRFEGN